MHGFIKVSAVDFTAVTPQVMTHARHRKRASRVVVGARWDALDDAVGVLVCSQSRCWGRGRVVCLSINSCVRPLRGPSISVRPPEQPGARLQERLIFRAVPESRSSRVRGVVD